MNIVLAAIANTFSQEEDGEERRRGKRENKLKEFKSEETKLSLFIDGITHRLKDPKNAILCAKSLQSCPILCGPMDCSLPIYSVHGILQARILE